MDKGEDKADKGEDKADKGEDKADKGEDKADKGEDGGEGRWRAILRTICPVGIGTYVERTSRTSTYTPLPWVGSVVGSGWQQLAAIGSGW
ncbi:hypothetical protein V496_07157 [Pseudogymnoascus sp. VKM F-4515 (FW-2607)]|nr:hypothetical protein V496_07157 [Pseudogymnoascus sp. VKM F-4515 (FW-2607)]